jgi:hypothetical protein
MNRQHERRFHFVEIVLESASGRRDARMNELSYGGCFVESLLDHQVGEPVSFEIKNSEPPIRFEGRIAYNLRGIGFGVAFDEVSKPASEYLLSILGEEGQDT